MTTTTLTITVSEGVAPEPINVTLLKNGTQIFHKQSAVSVSIPFNDLDQGLYGLFINGKNPRNENGTPNPNAQTKCELSIGNISLLPTSDSNPDIEKDEEYIVQYHFTV